MLLVANAYGHGYVNCRNCFAEWQELCSFINAEDITLLEIKDHSGNEAVSTANKLSARVDGQISLFLAKQEQTLPFADFIKRYINNKLIIIYYSYSAHRIKYNSHSKKHGDGLIIMNVTCFQMKVPATQFNVTRVTEEWSKFWMPDLLPSQIKPIYSLHYNFKSASKSVDGFLKPAIIMKV